MSEQIEKIRHSLSHLLAASVQYFFPEVKFGIGPAIEKGFYYDFDKVSLEEEDLEKIEGKMKELIAQNLIFEQKMISKEEARSLFKEQPYKLELIDKIEEDIVSIYQTGNFIDLCKGPHVASTQEINPQGFKLQKIAGAYWQGDEKKPMLARIYGLAFETKAELDDYLNKQAEAEKRDHRKLGKELDLFHIDEEVGIGLILWHPKGAILWRIIEDFWFKQHLENGYELVRTPHIGNRKLWEHSGHWGFYSNSMYPPLEASQSLEELQQHNKVKESEQFLLKPMNCPFHIAIYNNSLHSYRDLPIRWAETGTVYRYEKKGELSGLTRVRGFTQDDAHIICRKDQAEDELKRVIDFILYIYKAFGFGIETVHVYLSLRDPNNKSKYAGSDEGWELTESILRKVAVEKGLQFTEELGEAAFYGPKLDFKIKDVLGREWQCSTLQFDFNLPERFKMEFTNEKGEKEQPYMLHRALLGSFERFIGLLIEHYAGAFPFWLAPVQIKILPISEAHQKYAYEVAERLKQYRLKVDDNNETIGKKIRDGELEKIPYLIIVGDKEVNNNTISVRQRGKIDLGELQIEDFVQKLNELSKNNL
ncbi:MAG TPA: threonine--tRNA ligase [Candidatus Paceibacterota bacterium]|nr:threonine--tRNA ligase [Candidatus Pacearchaeota archaeon]HPC30493.1 threonine--tRNA ligase [Candidatus Pacearchaeota archaeon]HQK58387.1 threonine--tRNA ligase [Candidatus Pacearchaeota archaeon]HRR94715.1 threonine--tRNA ligase [Candidatus Paceibacterota bacterium]HRU20815.1 threonine--tRNA ligase [Candidatus Paceibacterota bacterium]